jgi:ribitol 2-dehydrogenase
MDLNGKVAIVTGASSGIGRATTFAFAREGVKQVVTARSADKLETLAKELPGESLVVAADMTNPKDIAPLVQRTLEHFGRLDILLANAGIYVAGDVIGGDPDAWDRLLQTNVSGVFRLVHAALPHLIESGSGDIVVTSSISGHKAIYWEPVYSASKHAVQSFVHGLRRQLLQTGVRVCDPAEVERRAAAGEGLRSEDVAEAIVFMLTRPRNVTIRDLVMLPRAQNI